MSDVAEQLAELSLRLADLEKTVGGLKKAKAKADRPSAVEALEAWIIADNLHTVNGSCQQTADAYEHARDLRSKALEAV